MATSLHRYLQFDKGIHRQNVQMRVGSQSFTQSHKIIGLGIYWLVWNLLNSHIAAAHAILWYPLTFPCTFCSASMRQCTQMLFQQHDSRCFNMGVSENSVPLHPMVLLIIIPFLNGYFIGGIPHFQTNPYVSKKTVVSSSVIRQLPSGHHVSSGELQRFENDMTRSLRIRCRFFCNARHGVIIWMSKCNVQICKDLYKDRFVVLNCTASGAGLQMLQAPPKTRFGPCPGRAWQSPSLLQKLVRWHVDSCRCKWHQNLHVQSCDV